MPLRRQKSYQSGSGWGGGDSKDGRETGGTRGMHVFLFIRVSVWVTECCD